MNLIIVNGLPATGKTFLAAELSNLLNLPCLHKDVIKEFVFDLLTTNDRNWSRQVGMASMDFLHAITEAAIENDVSMIVESAFYKEISEKKFYKVFSSGKVNCIEIYCKTSSEVRRKRFIERNESGSRHQGHLDSTNYTKEDEKVLLERYAPLRVGILIEVDTTDFSSVDPSSIAKQVKELVK